MGDPWPAMASGCCCDGLQAAGAQLPMEGGHEAEDMADGQKWHEDVLQPRTDPELVATVVGVGNGFGWEGAWTWALLGGQNVWWMLPGQGCGVQAACSALEGPSAGLLMLHEKVCLPQPVAVAAAVAAVAAAVALHRAQDRLVPDVASAWLTRSKSCFMPEDICHLRHAHQKR